VALPSRPPEGATSQLHAVPDEPQATQVSVGPNVRDGAETSPQQSASPAAALNAPTYLPRALMLVHTLPLRDAKYQFKAEQFAKANGCVHPAATMNIRTATSETFTVACADGAALSIRCDPDCRDLQ
jgi:hypothetical protein